MQVSMQTFFRTGLFGDIELGMRHSEVLARLGEPDTWGGTNVAARSADQRGYWPDATSWEHAAMLVYGDIEFHFWTNLQYIEHLALIYKDDLSSLRGRILSGGNAIQLDPWFIRSGVPQIEVEHHLTQAAISFSPVPPIFEGSTRIMVGPGIELAFADEADGLCPVGLAAFGYCVRDVSKEQFEVWFPKPSA